jgi:hypothetical protein
MCSLWNMEVFKDIGIKAQNYTTEIVYYYFYITSNNLTFYWKSEPMQIIFLIFLQQSQKNTLVKYYISYIVLSQYLPLLLH